MNRLIEIMAALRTPKTGCPWDLEQDFSTIAPYTIEEAYEVADAIQRGDMDDLKDELGDLLLQVVFHARMAEEANFFSFGDVAATIGDKMVRRHPHVFGTTKADDPDTVKINWEDIKAEEKAERSRRREAAGQVISEPSLLDDVPLALPALQRAVKLQKRAARVGFDWPDTVSVMAKIDEELEELKVEVRSACEDRNHRLQEEIGDLLLAVSNLARHLKIDPETALRQANAKFNRRFRKIETVLAENGKLIEEASLEEMETIWVGAKELEKKGGQAT